MSAQPVIDWPQVEAEIRRSERERIASQIVAQEQDCPAPYHDQFPKPSCWQCARNGAFHRAARIALGMGPGDALG